MASRKNDAKTKKGHSGAATGHSGCCQWCGEIAFHSLKLIPSYVHGWHNPESRMLCYADVCQSCYALVSATERAIGEANGKGRAKQNKKTKSEDGKRQLDFFPIISEASQ